MMDTGYSQRLVPSRLRWGDMAKSQSDLAQLALGANFYPAAGWTSACCLETEGSK